MKKYLLFLSALLAVFALSAAPSHAPDSGTSRKLVMTSARAGSLADLGKRARPLAPPSAGGHAATTSMRLSTSAPAALPALRAPGGTELLAAITHDGSWGNLTHEGLYNISTTSPLLSCVKETDINGTAFYADGAVYTPYVEDWGFMVLRNFLRIDPVTGQYQTVNTEFTDKYALHTSTWLPRRNYALAYGIETATDDHVLLTVDLLGNVTLLARLDPQMNFTGGLCADASGKVYGMSTAGDLYTISLPSGACTLIGSTGATTVYATALCYDTQKDVIYYTTCYESTPSAFYTIDPATATATRNYEFDRVIEARMLYLPEPAAPSDAPGAPQNVTIDFPNGGLSGSLTFLPPALTYAGDPGQGELDYFVELDGIQAAAGKTSYGAPAVSVPVSVATEGNHIFRVYCSNEAGDGEDYSTTFYVGPDTPLPVANVSLSYADGRLSLSWDPVKGEKDGYIDQSKVTYTIIRMDGISSEEVAHSYRETSFSEAFAEPQNDVAVINYSVKAIYNGIITDPVLSNKVMLGSTRPPLEDNFASPSDFESRYMAVDNNHDGKTWLWDDTKGTGAVSYRYHGDNPGDDYLVLPAMKLSKGKIYFFSFLAGTTNADNPERLAAYVGKAPTAEGLSTELVPPTVITTPLMVTEGVATGVPFETRFIPEEDGVYYFAIKSCSDPYMYRLFVTDVKVSAPLSTASPGAVTGIKLTPDPEGDSVVTIEFDAPSVDINGEPLTALSKVEVFRGDELVGSVTPAPGAHASLTDNAAGEGDVTYTIVPSNEFGEGVAQSATVFVGFNVPAAPRLVDVSTGEDYGEVVLNWTPVTRDINGLTLPEVTYRVCLFNEADKAWETVADNLEETTCTVRVCSPEAEQDFAQLAVYAVNYAGESERRASSVICVGRPYSMPYFESFRQGTLLGIQTLAGRGGWTGATDETFTDITSQDGDGAFAVFMGSQAGDSSRLFTGRIHIDEDAENPEFAFYWFGTSPADRNSIQVVVDEGGGYIELGEPFYAGSGTPREWNRASIDLGRFKGKDVQLGIQVTMGNGTQGTAFDNFTVKSRPAHDLAADVRLPLGSARPGETIRVEAQVVNYGASAESACTVQLEVNDRIVDTRPGPALQPGEKQSVFFDYVVSPVSPDRLVFRTHVSGISDGDWSNNISAPAPLDVILPDFPAVNDLSGATGDAGEVNLSWNAPEVGEVYIPVMETFEEADPFATMNTGDACGWTFIDRDGGPVGGMQDLVIPNVPDGRPASFFVLDAAAEGFNGSFSAHSGSKCLAAIYNVDKRTNDDWAISPELDGQAQTVSFFARAYEMSLPETVEILYSLTDAAPENFISLKTISGISTDRQRSWTRYSADLPAGARYFAIRFISTDTFMVMIDDVTYIPADSRKLTLLGYNVYRNGVRLNESPVAETSFTDREPGAEPAYTVTAVYNTGESRASNEIYPLGNAVDTIGTSLIIRGLRGAIEVAGTDGPVTVADLQGRVIYRGEATRIDAAPGIYVVRAARTTAKVLVR